MNNVIELRGSADGITYKYASGDVGIYGNMFHEHCELFLLISGEVNFICERGSRPLSPYELVIISPGVYHQFLVTGNPKDYTRFVLEFSPDFVGTALTASSLGVKEALHLTPRHPAIGCFERLREYTAEPYAGDFPMLCRAALTELLILLKHEKGVAKPEYGSFSNTSLRAVEYINTNIEHSLSLDEIAASCFVSVSTLCHTFQSEHHVSVMRYTREKKMQYARELLHEGISPAKTAERCGYGDYSTFYRAYISYYGQAPSCAAQPSVFSLSK